MEYLMSEQHSGNSSTRQKQRQQKILACYDKEVFGQRGREMVIKNGQKKWNSLYRKKIGEKNRIQLVKRK